MTSMDIESAALQSAHQLDIVSEENKVLKEKLQRLTNAAQQLSPPREASLDVCRGLATTLMIIDKYIGNVVPVMRYAPWDGINVADFGPATFLFLAGVSTALGQGSNRGSHRGSNQGSNSNRKTTVTAKAFRRSVWLFALGILLEGGFFHDRNRLSFGIDVGEFRVFGTLQRIAVAYLGTSLCEIWAPRSGHWTMTALIPAASAALLYGLHVPDWSFPLRSSSSTTISDNSRNPCPSSPSDATIISIAKVTCGVRGFYNTEPTCNAAAHIDRVVLGLKHMNPVAWYKHLPECRETLIPDWCYAQFEPEGILTTFSATATSLMGLHFGHVMVEKKQHLARLWSWTLASGSLVILGMGMHNAGLLFNRQLWSLSYLSFTAGTAGTLLSSVYFLVEANGWRGGFISPLLQVVGQHSLLLFGLLQCDVLGTVLQGFYLRCPQNSILSYLRDHAFHRILQFLRRRFYH